MKAFLLSAGLGTRLRPITDRVPKCLLPVDGRPLMAYWLDLFDRHGVTDVLVNTHHLRDSVERFLAETAGSWNVRVRTSHEPELLGSAGTVSGHRDWVATSDPFLICYGDNLTNADLTHIVDAHRQGNELLTMGLFEASDPTACGIATLDAHGIVQAFEEKPRHPQSRWANAGIYVASPPVLEYIHTDDRDLAHDVLPKLVGRMRGAPVRGYLRDIGTFESFAIAQIDWRGRASGPVVSPKQSRS